MLAAALLVGPLGAADFSDVDCVIEPHVVADVSSAVRGVMDTLEVSRGDLVKRGQVLATLEASVERATVALARARADMQHLIQARKARLEFTRRRLERNQRLLETKSVSPQVVDEAETDAVLAEMELEQALEEQRIAELELVRAREQLALRTIRSPIDGVVVQTFITPGESVEDRPILQIAQVDPLNVEVIAPAELFGTVQKGMTVEVLPEAAVGGRYEAEVTIVDQVIDAPSGTFGLRAELPNPDRSLPAGLRCRVRLPQ
jgi:RND family efflux transporter MFP subunit